MHKKSDHKDKVSICMHFSFGNCTYSDVDCWFFHGTDLQACEGPNFNCSFCDKIFTKRSEVMKHRKTEHRLFVPLCRHAMYGACIFSEETCWFVHDGEKVRNESENNDKIIKYNQEVFDKLFGMIEKMTERIVQMENVL